MSNTIINIHAKVSEKTRVEARFKKERKPVNHTSSHPDILSLGLMDI